MRGERKAAAAAVMTSILVFVRFAMLCTTLIMSVLFTISSASADPQLDNLIASANKDKKIVMLELGSIGCIPCENMKPVMAKLRANYMGRLDVIFVDIRKDREAARKFGVYGIPTQVFLDRNGREFHRHIGYYPYEQIVPVLKKAGI